MSDDTGYFAFISYSHKDERVARWLHNALETYRVPLKLVGEKMDGGKIPRRLLPVFRDREELPSAGSLSSVIESALRNSRALIVIASPHSAQSRWVESEIRHFKAQGGQRVLCLIIDGEPNASARGNPELECFPPSLRFEVQPDGQLSDTPVEVIAADIRPGCDRKKDALLKLVAGILDLGLDALKQREHHRQLRRMLIATGLSLAASIGAVALALVAWQSRNEARHMQGIAEAQTSLAEARQSQAEDLVSFMLGDLHQQLQPIGRLDVLDSLSDKAMAYFSQVDAENLSERELRFRSESLRQLGNLRVEQGKLDEASPAFIQALALDREQIRRHPDNAELYFNIGQSQFYIGYGLYLRGLYPEAQPWFEKYRDSAEALLRIDPDNPAWRQEMAYALDNLALISMRQDELEACVRHARGAEQWNHKVLELKPDNQTALFSRSESLNKLALCAQRLDDQTIRLTSLQESLGIRKRLVDLNPSDFNAMFMLSVTHGSLASEFMGSGRWPDSVVHVEACEGYFANLTQQDPSNAKWASFAASCLFNAGKLFVYQGDLVAALKKVEMSQSMLQELQNSAYDGATETIQFVLLLAHKLTILNQLSPATFHDQTAQQLEELINSLSLDNNSVHPAYQIACATLQVFAGREPPACENISRLPLQQSSSRLLKTLASAMRDVRAGLSESDSAATRALNEERVSSVMWKQWRDQFAATEN